MKRCGRCGSKKPLSEFGISSKTDEPLAYCKPCYVLARAAHQRWLDRNPGIAAKRTAQWRKDNREQALHSQKRADRKLKDAAYAAYGGYRCVCCGETTEAFLSIDHINNDGANHRRSVERRSIYKWLKRHKYPEGFQILCMNCNFGKARNGGICPHQCSEGSTTMAKASTPQAGRKRGAPANIAG
jgi:hypothetical protein